MPCVINLTVVKETRQFDTSDCIFRCEEHWRRRTGEEKKNHNKWPLCGTYWSHIRIRCTRNWLFENVYSPLANMKKKKWNRFYATHEYNIYVYIIIRIIRVVLYITLYILYYTLARRKWMKSRPRSKYNIGNVFLYI